MSEASASGAFAYDEVPYPDALVPNLTPDFLCAAARGRGLSAADPTGASVLEIGCGGGINLIAIGAGYPATRCVGFDLSQSAIEGGRALAAGAGLTNVHLEHGDILTWPRDGDKFDYIVSHGVYTWVPEAVRTALLELIAARLAPGGIAYLGYDALPASAVKLEVQRFLAPYVAHIEDPDQRVDSAVAILRVMARHQHQRSRFKTVLDQLMEAMPNLSRGYLFHDWLAEFYSPVSVGDLAAAASEFGLAFAGDTLNTDLYNADLDEDARALIAAAGDDLVARNAAADMLRGTHTFRADLLVRADAQPAPAARGWRELTYTLDPRSMAARGHSGAAVDSNAQAVVNCLAERAPAELGYGDLTRHTGLDADALDDALLRTPVFHAVTRHSTPQPFVLSPGDRPLAGRLIRVMLADGDSAISLRHRRLRFADERSRRLICLCDGNRTIEAIAAAMLSSYNFAVSADEVRAAIKHYAPLGIFEH